MLKKIFGIVSWLPDNEAKRKKRAERIQNTLEQLEQYWPDIDILIIAQNWKDFNPETINHKIIYRVDNRLGIRNARNTLREKFLELDYDYIILLDDDILIETTDNNATKDYIESIDKNPGKFAFIKSNKAADKTQVYKYAQLNLCAISKEIFSLEKFDIDPEAGEGHEDLVFSHLLHYKYPKKEFLFPKTITHTQFQNKEYNIPSTWSTNGKVTALMHNDMKFLKAFKAGNFNVEAIKNDKAAEPKQFDYLSLFI